MDERLQEAFASGIVQLFVGAGLSSKMYPTAKMLCDALLNERSMIDMRETCVKDMLGGSVPTTLDEVARFYQTYNGKAALVEKIRSLYGKQGGPSELHRKLWKLPHVRVIYTTNFDCAIEDAITRPKQPPTVITRFSAIPISELRGKRVVFKPHGCARTNRDRRDFVISSDDYLNYGDDHPLERIKLFYDLSTRVFLFMGYSLRDQNLRKLILEANRTSNVNSYAVVLDAPAHEARYWREYGVNLIKTSADEFVDDVLAYFPPDESEFEEKTALRLSDKEAIAQKALSVVQSAADSKEELNLIIDAGTTCLALGKFIMHEMLQRRLTGPRIQIITNSPPAIAVVGTIPPERGGPSVSAIGGPYRYSTRAHTPSADSARAQLKEVLHPGKTLAFIGVTAIDSTGLKTKTEEEVAVKKEFIQAADHVYVLADHSKSRPLDGFSFAKWQPNMTILTNRPEELEHLAPFVRIN